ncbi:unnamed protein product [Closterium sp. NIES-54]
MVEAAVVVFGVELLRGEDLAVARGTAAPSERDPYAPAASYGVDIFGLDYDAILVAMYALSVSAEGDCYLCLPPDPGIAAAALGASESALPGTAPVEALHTFTLDSGASRCFFCESTTLTPLPAPCSPVFGGSVRLTPQRAAPHSSSFPPMIAPLQTLHMDMWGPARVSGQDRERYFLLLRERFCEDLPVLRLHSHRGGEFSSDLLRDFCRGEGILQLFTLPTSSQQNRVAERRIGLVMEVACTSMIHAAAPHFLWPFAVRYAAHQLNLCPRVSLPETSPTLRWTGKVGDASVFRTDSFTERRERESRPTSPVRAVRTGRCVLPLRPPPVPGTYVMALRPSSVPLRSDCPPSIGGECALGMDVLEDRQEDFECLAAAVPHLVAMLLAPEGDPDAPDIPNPRSYTEAITGPYSSQWQAAMDAKMASWKSTGTTLKQFPLLGRT